MNYKLSIITGNYFDIEYNGKPIYFDLSIIFKIKSKFLPKKILETLDKIKLVHKNPTNSTGNYCKDAQNILENLKKTIKKGDSYFRSQKNYYSRIGYVFSFEEYEKINYINEKRIDKFMGSIIVNI